MIEIRPATTDDIPAIQSVAEVAFRATYAEILTPDQLDYMMDWMYSTTSLHSQMENEGHRYYVAWDGATPVGYVSIQQEGDDLFHLQKIYVLPERQGERLGRRLFEQACTAVKALHPAPCTLELNVNRYNRALGFYERMGMQIARQGDFPIGNGYYMNDYIMSLSL